ncbi:glycosyltransferase [Geomonas sp. RF6]|uniref:glycosyltransferase family 2 protein n=1 Tax=Geomonas sp. RF6 TaxID=2897342 RepID=UPI001E3C4E48|nr:glycosyltransferase [Geomonas sp. RF6]UFS69439.1 glycosyltransferase [Geomonas sp. RF6]
MTSPCQTISVIIPCYNAEKYLGEAIESVLSQSVPPYEVLVVDDGSTDRTPDVVRRFGARVRYLARANGGVSSARNAGIGATTGRNLVFLDSDDLLMPDALRTLASALAAHRGAGIAFGLFHQFEEDPAKPLPSSPYVAQQIEKTPHDTLPDGTYLYEGLFSALLRGRFIPIGGTMVRRCVVEAVGAFDERFHVGEDRDLWLRATVIFPFICVNRPVLNRRIHSSNLSSIRYQQLYNDFNIEIARKLIAAFPEMQQDDQAYLRQMAAECSRVSARHFLGEGKATVARNYVLEYGRWQGWHSEAAFLLALSLVPDSLLAPIARLREKMVNPAY